MISKVVVLSGAKDDFATLPVREQRHIAAALGSLAEFPAQRTGIKKLRPLFAGYRKRSGDYRILFDFENTTIFVRRILHRKDAYRI